MTFVSLRRPTPLARRVACYALAALPAEQAVFAAGPAGDGPADIVTAGEMFEHALDHLDARDPAEARRVADVLRLAGVVP